MPTARPGKAGAEVITDFCAQPPADVVLLVTGGEWSKKHGGKWSEAIARTGCLVVARQVRPDQMTGWVEARLRKQNGRAHGRTPVTKPNIEISLLIEQITQN